MRLPAGVLGMLALVAAVESFVTRHELDAISAQDWQYHLARRDAARAAKGCDVLVFGDSQMKFGVLPKVLGRRGGLRAYNLAVWGGQAPVTYDLFRRVLRGGARPSAVVVNYFPHLLAMPTHERRGQLPFLLGAADALRLGLETRDPALTADLLARQALPSVRSRGEIRSWLRAAVGGRTNRLRLLMPEALRHWADNDGATVVPAFPGRPVDGPGHQRLLYRPGWTPDRVNVAYVRRFLRLAADHGVTVYLLIPPVHPDVQRAKEAAGFDRRYVAFVAGLVRRYPGVVVLDGRHAGYDPRVLLDADHLGREGAYALSQDLGELLPRLLRATPPDRWVTLPPYRPRPADAAPLAARLDVFLPEPAATVVR